MSSPGPRRDRDSPLGERARDDREVWEFYRAHAGEVRGFLYNIGTPAEHIDDIVQDAFLAAAVRWATLRGTNPRAYVFAVARNQRKSRLREDKEGTGHTVVGLPIEQPEDSRRVVPDPADVVISRITLNSALAALPASQRQAIVLRKIYGFTTVETAQILGKPENTVKSYVARGLTALHNMIDLGEEAKEQ